MTALYPDCTERPYAMVERLAEYGIIEMGQQHEARALKFASLLQAEGAEPTSV